MNLWLDRMLTITPDGIVLTNGELSRLTLSASEARQVAKRLEFLAGMMEAVHRIHDRQKKSSK